MSDRTMRGQLASQTTKLLLLALDPAAASGEVDNAAIALVRSLRRQYRDGHAFIEALVEASPPSPPEVMNVYGTVRMPFGKHRGRRLRDIPPEYLLWVLSTCTNADPYLRVAIRRYLE